MLRTVQKDRLDKHDFDTADDFMVLCSFINIKYFKEMEWKRPPGRLNYTWQDDDNNEIKFFIIYVPSQQPQGQLQTLYSVDTLWRNRT
jgi:hypothetical protein